MVIPTENERVICFPNGDEKEYVATKKGELLYFAGDVAHGGKTYDRNDPSWHFSIHFYIDSTHHKYTDDRFQIVNAANFIHAPQHCRYLMKDYIAKMEYVLEKVQKQIQQEKEKHLVDGYGRQKKKVGGTVEKGRKAAVGVQNEMDNAVKMNPTTDTDGRKKRKLGGRMEEMRKKYLDVSELYHCDE